MTNMIWHVYVDLDLLHASESLAAHHTCDIEDGRRMGEIGKEL